MNTYDENIEQETIDHIEDIYSKGSNSEVIMQKLKNTYNITMIKKIIDEFQFDVNYNNCELFIHYIAFSNILIMLLDYGANPWADNDNLILKVCKYGSYDLIKRLLELVPVNVREGGVLSKAIYCQEYEVIKLIMDSGYNIELPESKKALLGAAKRGEPEILQLLLTYGIDASIFNDADISSYPKTIKPMYNNVDERYLKIVDILLSYHIPVKTIFRHLIYWYRWYVRSETYF